jgi:hypothetical protein
MKLISEIINDLVNDQCSLTTALNKTKVLANRVCHDVLLNWVDHELKGYPTQDDVPEYRITYGTIIGNFLNNGFQVTNYPLPLPSIGDDLDRKLREFRVQDNIATLESYLTTYLEKDNDSLVAYFPEDLTRLVESIMKNANGPYFQLTDAGVKVPLHFATQVLSAIKDKLLEFMLEMEKEFGLETELIDLKNNNAKITYIMNNTINSTGDGNIINTGNHAKINATITITKGNKEVLEKTLRENCVDQEDISELIEVIDTEEASSKAFGVKVNGWIQKMFAKSLDGSWQVGIGAAGTLLAEAIKAYYGL